MTTESFGKRLKQYRLEREWTIEHIAGLTRMSGAAISRIENEKVVPRDLTTHKIGKALPGFQLEEVA